MTNYDLVAEGIEEPRRIGSQHKARDMAMRWLQACVDRDADFIRANSVEAPLDAFASIGTSGEPFSRMEFASHLEGLKKAGWGGLDLVGYEFGAAAWFYGVETGLLPWGEPLTIRISLMLLKVNGGWKACLSHVSESLERAGVELD